MRIIKINGAENKQVSYLFNKVMPIMKEQRCGGLFKIASGDVQINAWSEKVAIAVKEALSKFKIVFTEVEE